MTLGNGTAVPENSDDFAIRSVGSTTRSRGGFRAWHQLEAEDRLALIETALKIPANDFADELPLAL